MKNLRKVKKDIQPGVSKDRHWSSRFCTMRPTRTHSGDTRLFLAGIALLVCIIIQYDCTIPSLHADITAQNRKGADNSCEELRDKIQNYLQSDVKENVTKAAELSLQIPFDGSRCGGVHYSVVASLISHGIFPERYSDYIIKTLYSIMHSSMDYRTTTCLHYIAGDGHITDEEWNAGLHVVKSAKGISLPVYLKYVFINNERYKEEVILRRIAEIVTLAGDRKIGDIEAVPVEDVIFSLIKGLENERTMEFSNTLYILEKYRHMIPDSEEYNQKAAIVFHSAINRLMDADSNRRVQTRIVNDIVAFLKTRKKSENPAHILIELAYSIDRKVRHTRDPFYEDLLDKINLLADWFCFSLQSTNFMNRLKRREAYIKKYGIRCP